MIIETLISSFRLAQIQVRIEAATRPRVDRVPSSIGLELHFVLVGAAAAAELTIYCEAPRRILRVEIAIAVGEEGV